MKNLSLKMCSLAVLISSLTPGVYAANQSVDLKVQGTLVMGACTPSFSAGGIVDYGKLSISTLKTDATNQLGTQSLTLNLTCESPTKVGWTTVDDRADSEQAITVYVDTDQMNKADELFGLGKTAGAVNLGGYGIRFNNNASSTIADGKASKLLYSDTNGSSWNFADGFEIPARVEGSRIITFGDSNNEPLAFTTASDVFQVGSAVQDTTTLAISDDTPIDGQATFTVVYL